MNSESLGHSVSYPIYTAEKSTGKKKKSKGKRAGRKKRSFFNARKDAST
jgi:hypothetical protein